MTKEERMAKLRAARKPKGTSVTPTVLMEEFQKSGETFKRLYYDEEKKLGVFRRTHSNSGILIGYEVVIGKGQNLNYPTTNDFGKLGWCFCGSDEHCKKQIREKAGIIL